MVYKHKMCLHEDALCSWRMHSSSHLTSGMRSPASYVMRACTMACCMQAYQY